MMNVMHKNNRSEVKIDEKKSVKIKSFTKHLPLCKKDLYENLRNFFSRVSTNDFQKCMNDPQKLNKLINSASLYLWEKRRGSKSECLQIIMSKK